MIDKLRIFAQPVQQINCQANVIDKPSQGGAPDCSTGFPKVGATTANVAQIMQIIFGILGAIAVIMIIISAIQLASAQGDPNATTKARNTIIYASVGLAIALSAELIVSFVLTKL